MEVISIIPHLAKKELIDLLELSGKDADTMIYELEDDKTLSQALRTIGFRSANQINQEIWEDLRAWRDNYYPDIHDTSVNLEFEFKIPPFLQWFFKK